MLNRLRGGSRINKIIKKSEIPVKCRHCRGEPKRVSCAHFLWFEATAVSNCSFLISMSVIQFSPSCSLSSLCSAVSSASLSLHLISLSSLCSAVSSACLSLCLLSLSSLLFLLLAFLFVSSVFHLCCFFCLPFSLSPQSLVSAVSSACLSLRLISLLSACLFFASSVSCLSVLL